MLEPKESWNSAKPKRRRRIYVGQALLTAGLALSLAQAGAQDSRTGAAKSTDNTTQKKNTKTPAIRIVPLPRAKTAAGKAAAVPAAPAAPPSAGGAPNTLSPPPGDQTRAGRRGASGPTFQFDFHGSDINNVLKFYAQMSHMTILTDPTLSGNVTIINPEPVDLDQAFLILQQVLAIRGFNAIQNHDVISIMSIEGAGKNTSILNPGINNSGPTPVDPRDQVMTQVIPLDNVEADSLAKDLQPLINKGASLVGSTSTNSLIITDTASNVQRFLALVHGLDKASANSELRTYPLKRANASDVADLINNLFKQMSSRGRAGAPPMPGQPGFNPGQPGQPQAVPGSAPAVMAVADLPTNSVFVVASPDNQERIANEIINRIDGDDASTLDTKIRKIQYANAVDIANMVNQVLNNMMGNGQNSSQNSPFQQRAFGGFGGFFGGGFGGNNQQQQTVTSSDPFGKVVADPRTNTVLITANTDRMRKIDDLIDQLDKPVPAEATTFVFPLKNAHAEDVSYALGQAFNTSSNQNSGYTSNYYFGNGNGNSSQNGRQPINRRLGSSSSSGNGFGRAAGRMTPPGPPNPPDSGYVGDPNAPADNGGSAEPQGIPGVMTPNGFVPTQGNGSDSSSDNGQQKPTRQFFGRFGGFGGSSGLGQSTSPMYGPGRTGAYSNLLQLQGNVWVTPSPGGDSLIVTTLPGNYEAVRQIIESLDVVPRQVMIEVIAAEVTLTKDEKLGGALNGIFARLFGKTNSAQAQIGLGAPGFNTGTNGTSLDPTATGAQFVINGASYAGLLQAIENDNKVKLLATPRVFTANEQQAEIDITTNIPYVSGTTAGGLGTFVVNTVQTQQVGYILNVTPRITSNGLVTVDVSVEDSALLYFETLGTGAGASPYPVVDDRYANTEATVQDGQTLAIGGLMQDSLTTTINKIPLLSDIPIIGQFFRSREKIKNETELVLFITPHVVDTTASANAMTLKQAAAVVHDIPDLSKQQPNLRIAPPAKTERTVPTIAPNTGAAPNSGAPNNSAPQQTSPPQQIGPPIPGTGGGASSGASSNP